MNEQRRVDIVKLTPEKAAEWLATSTLNRKLRERSLDAYAREMDAGRWHLSPDAIAFDDHGHMTNGHHRCTAVIRSGVPIEVIVVHSGVSMADSLMSTDAGVSRKLADVLLMMGEHNTSALGATIRYYNSYVTKQMRSGSTGRAVLTLHECIALLEANPNIRESVRVADQVRRVLHVPSGLMAALLYVFASIDEDDHDAFVIKLLDGDGLAANDPRFQLREACLRNAMATRKLPQWRMAAMIIKAWNAFRDGETLTHLRFRAGGANPEGFPEAR